MYRQSYRDVLVFSHQLCFTVIGRTVRVSLPGGSHDDYSDLLTAAIDAQFDWVSYESDNYVRLSVIPSSKWRA